MQLACVTPFKLKSPLLKVWPAYIGGFFIPFELPSGLVARLDLFR